MQISWTRLPFPAHNQEEFTAGLTEWLGRVFYEVLPEQGYEVREEQIYTAFRMARAFARGETLLAEAGPGTGKTFAYLLPALCQARFSGKPVLVACASPALQAQLISPRGDIAALARALKLEIDLRMAADPGEYLCAVKGRQFVPWGRVKGARALCNWTRKTRSGARSEIPQIPDELWGQVAWDPSLPCDTCRYRGSCHVMTARQRCREAADLVVADHLLFARDLLTRRERQELGQMTLLPPYSAVVLDEGQHVPDQWQRVQGHEISARRLYQTLDLILAGYGNQGGVTSKLDEARVAGRKHLAAVLVPAAREESRRFLESVLAAALPGEGKRALPPEGQVLEATGGLVRALEAIQDELVTEEAMQEGTTRERALRAYQDRLDEVLAALGLLRSPEIVPWVEGESLWVVPREPLSLFGEGRLSSRMPVLFSSATLEPAYMARTLGLPAHQSSVTGVPFNLAEQVLVYQPDPPVEEMEAVTAVIRAMGGRSLVLLRSLAELQQYREHLGRSALPFRLLFEGDADRGAMLQAFRKDQTSVLVGATYWEGVDVPGASLSCVVIPRLPFPAHDPLILERRRQAVARGQDPFQAVDLPEMLLKLKQGAGRLIRTARDRGVLALLDRSCLTEPWAASVEAILPKGAERTSDLSRVASHKEFGFVRRKFITE